jgi:hypothetical protein
VPHVAAGQQLSCSNVARGNVAATALAEGVCCVWDVAGVWQLTAKLEQSAPAQHRATSVVAEAMPSAGAVMISYLAANHRL